MNADEFSLANPALLIFFGLCLAVAIVGSWIARSLGRRIARWVRFRRLPPQVANLERVRVERRQRGRRHFFRGLISSPQIVAILLTAAFVAFSAFYAPDIEADVAQRAISGRVTHIRDGDTIEVMGVPVRFQNLDCAESGTWDGTRATWRMTRLALYRRVDCSLTGQTSYDRVIGSCHLADGRDLGAVMISEGLCTRWR